MLPAAHRLRTAADFRETTRRGVKATRGRVVLYLTVSEDPSPARVGVVVSSAVGGSVVRHRAARRIRAAVAPYVGRLPSGSRLVVRALPGAADERDLFGQVRAGIDVVLASS